MDSDLEALPLPLANGFWTPKKRRHEVLSETEMADVWDKIQTAGPQPGEFFRHFKGHLYRVVALCLEEASMVVCVIYQDTLNGRTWSRTRDNFMSQVYGNGKWQRRFEPVGGY